MDSQQQRHMVYDGLYRQAIITYRNSGAYGVAQHFTLAMVDTHSDDDLTFMRLTACTRAEGLSQPSVNFLDEMIREVNQRKVKLSPERAEMIQGMMDQISADLCQELVMQAMTSARLLAQSLGSRIDISATHMGPGDSEWRALDSIPTTGYSIH